ncbi:protein translocase subunit SecF [Corynebacterium urinipleomorphum]|uniref:protein translocase subunit SecF n=1 Tax=Corynebacterium urinipleomorphum TaxID=1852380 RepID=UPI000B34D160|nr:protein translocase subunit SecF [Corynebacterium urinipleomorphum]
MSTSLNAGTPTPAHNGADASTTSVSEQEKAAHSKGIERLYEGTGAIDFIGRSKLWYIIAVVLVVISAAAMLIRGFNLGIDFEGGTKMTMPAGELVAEQVEETFVDATGITPELTQIVGAGDSRTLEINSEHLSQEQIDSAREAIYNEYKPLDASGEPSPDAIGDSTVSESWGSTITNRMLLSMLIFLVAASVYVALRLQRNMAIAAMVALLFDGVVILGIYALFGLEVTPAMIIGLLTVLTFSLYDTVIVFDKVKENTEGVLDSRRSTYAEETNLAVNETLMRSISTSVISALPIIALMIVAVWLLGVGTLQDLALIQLIGVVEGVISSLLLATSLLVTLTNAQSKYKEHNKLVAAYRAGKEEGSLIDGSGSEAAPATGAKRTVASPLHRTEAPIAEPARQSAATWRPNQS